MWLIPVSTAWGASQLRYEVDVWQVDAANVAVLERGVACRPPPLSGRDALPLVERMLEADPDATRVTRAVLAAAPGTEAVLTISDTVSYRVSAAVFAPGMLDLVVSIDRVGPEGERDEVRASWRVADGHRVTLQPDGLWVAVRPLLVDATDTGAWSDQGTLELQATSLIGDGSLAQRRRALDRILGGCVSQTPAAAR